MYSRNDATRDAAPRPEDFPLGPAEPRAAMRLLLLQSNNETVHVHFCEGSASCACERCRQGIPRGPNDIVVQVVHVGGGSCGAPLACEKEPHKPAASGEQKQEAGQPAVDSAPQKLFDPSQEQQTER
jgi:hypothetical protein